MGVPKFFRWISERYPKINQPIHAPPDPETRTNYFPSYKAPGDEESSSERNTKSKAKQQDDKVYIQKNSITPEFDRLYLDMNGIIHCSSHNNASDDNATIDPDTHIENSDPTAVHESTTSEVDGTVTITEAEIFRNVCYYVDRVVTDIAKPTELVYMAIDGVAPRAKMNQQRSRRYRSGKEREIENTFHGANLLAQKKREEEMSFNVESEYDNEFWNIEGGMDRLSDSKRRTPVDDGNKNVHLEEVEPGRYTGTFETSKNDEKSSPFDVDYEEFLKTIENDDRSDEDGEALTSFHSNTITPGTPFFERCTEHLQHFVKRKLHGDPRWKDLTIVFSGPDVPGEGEHKIMDFIRRQKHRKDYDPNTTHCMFGQDGDLIMLGLATHEPHFALLREEVVFDPSRKRDQKKLAESSARMQGDGKNDAEGKSSKKVSASIDTYIHNSNFEVLHMPILRDYLSYEFETKDVLPNSPFELEQTIDDFVFMTFIVGNDFLPHMPAIDIADEAFDLLFYTYKRNRWAWLKDEKNNKKKHPYLTKNGEIVCGKRLERFLVDLGKHEDPYYDNKKRSEEADIKRLRKSDKKAGRDASVPPDAILAAKEEWDRTNYMEMLMSISEKNHQSVEGFRPVASNKDLFTDFESDDSEAGDKNGKEFKFQPGTDEELDEGFMNRMGTLFRNSLTTSGDDDAANSSGIAKHSSGDESHLDKHVSDLKGRYYYEKFNFSPLDAEKHIALRKAYIEGLVWNLSYYYKGCPSWDWYYPYHYGPRLSDLRGIDKMLKEISFENNLGKPLKPFEQLMACLPPSSADLLPKPYQWLMKSKKSPIIDFYPESFTIDMNGKRWPWEAVVLLPFIDSQRLIDSSRKFVKDDLLSDGENRRNRLGDPMVYSRDESTSINVSALNDRPNFGAIEGCNVREDKYDETSWKDDNLAATAVLRPELLPGTNVPHPGFPTLKDAPVHGLSRRKLGINIFGMRSRYRSAVLQLDREIPMIPSAEAIAGKFIGTTLYFRYPFLQEGFVTAVSDAEVTVRGKEPARRWTPKESQTWKLKNDTIKRQYETGEGLTGSGGWNVPDSEVTISIRPLKEIETLPDGTKVKVYARLEVEVPIVAAIWSPSNPDPRFVNVPARLEKDPYRFGSQPSTVSVKNVKKTIRKSRSKVPFKRNSAPGSKILPDFSSSPLPGNSILPKKNILPASSTLKNGILGTSNFSTISSRSLDRHQIRKVHTPMRTNHFSKPISRQFLQRRSPSRVLAVASIAAACLAKNAAGATFLNDQMFPSIGKQSTPLNFMRGGANMDWPNETFEDNDESDTNAESKAPPLEFAHGTTTLSFIFDGGIVAAVDSRASIGNFVGSKTVQKVLPINNHMLGTMAGGAADCSFWIRKLQAESRHYELAEGKPITVARVSRLLADYLYANRHLDLSVGTMIMGYDESGPSIYYVDNKGTRIRGDLFSVGSGSTFALGVLDTEKRGLITKDEAIALGIKAIRHATFRDAYSGGYIAIYVITEEGWEKVFSEDLALSGNYVESINK